MVWFSDDALRGTPVRRAVGLAAFFCIVWIVGVVIGDASHNGGVRALGAVVAVGGFIMMVVTLRLAARINRINKGS